MEHEQAATPDGAEPVPVSGIAGIANAWLDNKAFKPNSYDGKPRHLSEALKGELQEMVDKIVAHVDWLPDDRKVTLLEACLSVSPINCSWQQHAIAKIAVWQAQEGVAQGIEARQGGNGEAGAVHESAVRQDAPETLPGEHQ